MWVVVWEVVLEGVRQHSINMSNSFGTLLATLSLTLTHHSTVSVLMNILMQSSREYEP